MQLINSILPEIETGNIAEVIARVKAAGRC